MVQIKPGADPELPKGFPPGLHSVVWTLPYASETNPIEHVWSRGKEHVRGTSHARSTPTTVRTALITGLIGDGASVEGCTPEFCQKLIAHTRSCLDRWVGESKRLTELLADSKEKGVAGLTSAVRSAYGPIARAHRAVRGKATCGDATDNDDDDDADAGDEVVDGGGVVVPPAAPPASESTSATGESASGSGGRVA